MKVSELKKLVAEEYNKYMAEQDLGLDLPGGPAGGPPPPPPGAPVGGDPEVKVSDKDIDLDKGGENPLETLKDIFDMLKDFFEGEEGDKAPKAPKKDDKGGDKGGDKKDDKGDDKGDDKKDDKKDKEKEKLDEALNRMQTIKLQNRFKKLANIIK